MLKAVDTDEFKRMLMELPRGSGAICMTKYVLGLYKANGQPGIPSSETEMSRYCIPRWKMFLDAPFNITNKCCNIMKKDPIHQYMKDNGKIAAITGQMANESRRRATNWVKYGCNIYDKDDPKSNPMSFWLEQDVLLYIKKYDIPYCSVYGDITDCKGNEVELSEYEDKGIFELDRPCLQTSGCSRTGCMFCGFGCHLEAKGKGRFERLKETHPKIYDYIMRPASEGGLNYKFVIDWINENAHTHIRY